MYLQLLPFFRLHKISFPSRLVGWATSKPMSCRARSWCTCSSVGYHDFGLNLQLLISLSAGFTRLPQYRHPIMPLSSLRGALSRTNWAPHLLPLPFRALTHAILATAALISPHPAILGDGPLPASLDEVSAWPSTTDWQSFGRRREGACRALSNEAFHVAKEAEVTVDCSAESAATCYLLDFLDSRESNPWLSAEHSLTVCVCRLRSDSPAKSTFRFCLCFAREGLGFAVGRTPGRAEMDRLSGEFAGSPIPGLLADWLGHRLRRLSDPPTLAPQSSCESPSEDWRHGADFSSLIARLLIINCCMVTTRQRWRR